ncbi:DUF6090 family protein [Winogradskyella ursingii]|uniref:DUF6090 family protein n=1 Tax=Winogradskyella ursingii TaxID=2686079 RepID=UPI0015CAF46B|nr:DUF6090 family protein [Winogradskyella ursingii]
MIKENRFSKYLLYAIGEIILVVIGILIALQINNWNETRKDRVKEQALLRQLNKEFESNLLQLDLKISNRKSILKAGNRIIQYFDNPDAIIRDSLIANISVLTIAPTFNPVNSDLLNSGKIELIQNEKLKQLLTEWQTYVVQLAEIENEYVGNYRNILLPLIIEMGIGREVDNAFWENENNFIFLLDKNKIKDKPENTNSNKNIDLEEIINNKELEGVVSNAIYINYLSNIESQSVRERINQILNLITEEIE